jgi:hypothetical protein
LPTDKITNRDQKLDYEEQSPMTLEKSKECVKPSKVGDGR